MLFLGFQFIVGIVQKGVPCAPMKLRVILFSIWIAALCLMISALAG